MKMIWERLLYSVVAMCFYYTAVLESSAYNLIQGSSVSGGNSTSIAYSVDGTLGDIGGISSSGMYTGKNGYAGQLHDLVGIGVSVATNQVPEEGSVQLILRERYDDYTLGSGLSGTPEWRVVAGPVLSVSTQNVAQIGVVFEDEIARIVAIYNSQTGGVNFVVFNVDGDNYGIYAEDGADDAWQVAYFGLDNPDGIGEVDPDGDRMNNTAEWIACSDPTNRASVFKIIDYDFDSRVTVYFPSAVGRVYWLEKSTNIIEGSWEDLSEEGLLEGTGEILFLDVAMSETSAYFRVRVELSK